MDRKRSFSLLVAALLVVAALLGLACAGGESDADIRRKVFEMYEGYREDFPEVLDISPEVVLKLMDRVEIVFVDAREPEEREVSTLPGAIPVGEFLRRRAEFGKKLIVAYCTISYRSGKFAEEQAEEGVGVLNLRGGILGWVHAGGKVYAPNGQETRRVHVYGWRWDLLPEGYESVY